MGENNIFRSVTTIQLQRTEHLHHPFSVQILFYVYPTKLLKNLIKNNLKTFNESVATQTLTGSQFIDE